MMGLVRGWLLGITGAAILAALAGGLMPNGGVKQVGRLVCGLVLILAVLHPFAGGEMTNLLEQWEYDTGQMEQQRQRLQEEADSRMKMVIEEQLSAYSMDKAEELGVICQVQVSCGAGEDGIFLPEAAAVSGAEGQEERETVLGVLEELGLAPDAVSFSEEGGA